MLGLASAASAQQQMFVNNSPGGLTARWSQLWIDPGPNQNDLDSDSVSWADFTLAAPAVLDHIEWWGAGACELGFRIEVWRQDPGTVAYQPLGVFYYGGNHSIQPESRFTTTAFTTSPGPGGNTHYVLDLANPISLAANDATNPRWFIAVIGLTQQAYYTWDWAQGSGQSNRSFQWIRGAAPQFRSLPEGRAWVLSGTVPCYPNCDGSTGTPALNVNDFICFQSLFAAADPYADCNHDATLNVNDFVCFQAQFAAGCR
jgi:hypothetical protein